MPMQICRRDSCISPILQSLVSVSFGHVVFQYLCGSVEAGDGVLALDRTTANRRNFLPYEGFINCIFFWTLMKT